MRLQGVVRLCAVVIILMAAAELVLRPQYAYGLVPTTYHLGGGGLTITGPNVAGTGSGWRSACGWSAFRCTATLVGPVLAVSGLCAALTGPLSPFVCYAFAAVDAHDYAMCCL